MSIIPQVGHKRFWEQRHPCLYVLGDSCLSDQTARAQLDAMNRLATPKAHADALYVVVNVLVSSNLTQVITFALDARLPTIFNNRACQAAASIGRLTLAVTRLGGALPLRYRPRLQ